MWLSYSRPVCFHGDGAAWVSSHVVSPSFISSSYLEVFGGGCSKGGSINFEYFPLHEVAPFGIGNWAVAKYIENSDKIYIWKCWDVQLKRHFPKLLPFVEWLLGQLMEIKSGSLRKLPASYSTDQGMSRAADRYSWCELYFHQRSGRPAEACKLEIPKERISSSPLLST